MALRTIVKLKARGRTQIANFWLKQLTVTKKCSVTLIDKLIDEDQISEWLTAEITSHILKNKNTDRPKTERPVTCPPTIYETIISPIHKMQKYTEEKIGMP